MKSWPKYRLGDVAVFLNGRAFKPSEWSSQGIPIVRIQNLTNPSASANYYSGSCDQRYQIKNGDLLVSWSATLDVFEWNRGPALLNQHIFLVNPHDSLVTKRYLFYALKSIMDELRTKTQGATMKHITKGPFENTLIPVPPLLEQERIAKLLDEADSLRNLRTVSDQNMDKLIPAIFNEMFGNPITNSGNWPVYQIDQISVEGKRGVTTGPFGTQLGSRDFTSTGPEVFGIYSLGPMNSFRSGGAKRISEKKYNELFRFNVLPNDVLISRMGTVGKVTVVPIGAPPGIVSYHLIRVRADNSKCHPMYLAQLLSIFERAGHGLSKQAKGAIMSGINASIVASFKIPLPPLDYQIDFAEKVNAIHQLETLQHKSQNKLNSMFHSMVHNAFNGNI